MSDGASFDTTEIVHLVDAINKASGPALKDVEAVIFKGAMNIKQDAARRISGHPHWRRIGPSIDFDMHFDMNGPFAEIGPNHDKPQGNLAHIPEFGSPKSAPTPFMAPAAEAEEPKFAAALEALAVKALGL